MIKAIDHPSYSYLASLNPEAIVLPEFTPAFAGIGTNGKKSTAIYDFNQCVIQLVGNQDMKPSEAKEFLFLDVISQNVDDNNSPMFLTQDLMIPYEIWSI